MRRTSAARRCAAIADTDKRPFRPTDSPYWTCADLVHLIPTGHESSTSNPCFFSARSTVRASL